MQRVLQWEIAGGVSREKVMSVPKHYLSADQYLRDIWMLASKIRNSGWKPDFIVGLWRGGAPVAVSVHEFFKVTGWSIQHIPLKCASYEGIGENPGQVVFTHGDIVFGMFRKGDKVLFIDDVFDTGKTAAAVKAKMESLGIEMRLGCVYLKSGKNITDVEPDFIARDLGNDWIVFPHEIEGLTPDEIREKDPTLAELIEKASD